MNYIESQDNGLVLGPGNFAPFSTLPTGRRPWSCVEPRPEEDLMMVTVQRPGGLIGETHGGMLTDIAWGDPPGSIGDSAEREVRSRPQDVLGWHEGGCTYFGGIVAVNSLMTRPDERSAELLELFYQHWGREAEVYLPRIQNAAGRLADIWEMEGIEPEDKLLERARQLYDVNNIATVSGGNTARDYIINLHPYMGLNRETLRTAAGPQAYNDSLGASKASLAERTMSAERRGLRLAAMLLGAAVTPSAIEQAKGRELQLHIAWATEEGIDIMQFESPGR